ncbi:MAG: TorD/DmsD family molecular chaperone [Halobacteriota archaeon]
MTDPDPDFDRSRAQVYDVLAAVFDGEMNALREGLDRGIFRDLAASLPGDGPALGVSDLEPSALELGYDNLFEVPGPHYVPPFASAHRDRPSQEFESDSPHHDAGEAGELYGEPAREMATLFDRVGFEPTVGEGIPDHVAAELQFLSVLAGTKADLATGEGEVPIDIETVRETERAALSHLTWLGAFRDAVAEKDTATGVFAGLAALTFEYVAWDAAEHGVSFPRD